MTLGEVIKILSYDDEGNERDMNQEIEFHTIDRLSLHLLSVYQTGDSLGIDIGDDGE